MYFLDAFSELRKATVSFVMSDYAICLSVPPRETRPHPLEGFS